MILNNKQKKIGNIFLEKRTTLVSQVEYTKVDNIKVLMMHIVLILYLNSDKFTANARMMHSRIIAVMCHRDWPHRHSDYSQRPACSLLGCCRHLQLLLQNFVLGWPLAYSLQELNLCVPFAAAALIAQIHYPLCPAPSAYSLLGSTGALAVLYCQHRAVE